MHVSRAPALSLSLSCVCVCVCARAWLCVCVRERGGGIDLRVGFININDMYNNDGGQGGVRGCEAPEVK